MHLLRNSLILASVFSAACSVFAGGTPTSRPVPEEPSEFAQHVTWEKGSPTAPQFVPSTLLQQDLTSVFHEGSHSLQSLREAMAMVRTEKEAGKQPRCISSPNQGFARESAAAGKTLEEKIVFQDFAGFGTVVETVSGWYLSQTRTMVYVSLEDILWCAEDRDYPIRKVNIGDVVSTTLEMGTMELQDIPLCTTTPRGFRIPEVGDKVLILGSPKTEDPYLLGHSAPVFPVEDGQVLPQPYDNFRWETRAVDSLDETFGLNSRVSCHGTS